MKKVIKKIARELFAFLSSLQLAVVTLLTLAGVLAVGTCYESLYDAETARHYIYGTVWFACLLLLLGTNVFCSALSRWPWKRHHIGFLITHLGILTILTGSFITLLKAYEGQVILAEGESTKRMTLKEPELIFYDPTEKNLIELPAKFRFNTPTAQNPYLQKVFKDVLVKVDEYLPHAISDLKVEEGGDIENPALKVKVSGSRASLEEWLFLREYDRQRINLGPASVSYLDLPNEKVFRQILNDPQAYKGPVLWVDNKLIPVESNLGKKISLGAKKLTIENYLSNAAVTDEGLKNLSNELVNPAISLKITAGMEEDNHTAFAKYPFLATLHQANSKIFSTSIRLLILPVDLGKQKNEMVLARTEKGELLYSIRAGGQWSPILSYSGNNEVATGWMDFKFSISQHLEKAIPEKIYRKATVPKNKEEEGPPPAIHIALANEQEIRDFWIGRGEEREVILGNRRMKMAYGLKSKPLGFEVRLNNFQMGLNEGTKDPASFQSQVTVTDPGNLIKEDHLIAMNEPMKYDRYKLFQASYQLNPGGPSWSVLAVAYDPGVPVKYIGALVMVSGIITMFFLKPLFIQKNMAEKKRHKEILANQRNPAVLNMKEDLGLS